jgi:two-component system nitrogen regulation response regulator GlnG
VQDGFDPEREQDTRHSEVGWQLRAEALVPALTVVWHPDLERVGERVLLPQLARGRDVRISRLEPDFAAPRAGRPRSLGLAHLSRTPLTLLALGRDGFGLRRGECPIEIEVDGLRLDHEATVNQERLREGVVLLLAERIVLVFQLLDAGALAAELPTYGLIGESDALQRLRLSLARASGVEVPVLLRGATGTGKELVAQAIHQHGPRREQPFVAVNVGALPTELAAAELFGTSRGAYTGATRDRSGCFRRAHRGTLFLDEIGEASNEVQVMLYRVLETGMVRSLGEDLDRPVDVRVIAATDSDLEAAVDAGSFRAPLLHRLGGYEIAVPPLRARRDDIGRLLSGFLRDELGALGRIDLLESTDHRAAWLPARLVAQMARLDWPGNVRQLRNVCRELAVHGADRDQVEVGPQLARLLAEPVGVNERPASRAPDGAKVLAGAVHRRPGEVGEDELYQALASNSWRLKPAAAALGISRTSLYALMEAHPRVRTAASLSPAEVEASWCANGGDLEAMVKELEVSKEGIARRVRELGLR